MRALADPFQVYFFLRIINTTATPITATTAIVPIMSRVVSSATGVADTIVAEAPSPTSFTALTA